MKLVFDWAVSCGARADDLFISFRAKGNKNSVVMSYGQMRNMIRATAQRFLFNPNLFGTHSTRIGGATTLRAGGAPDSLLQTIGRWHSAATPVYYSRNGRSVFSRLQEAMSNVTAYNLNDAKLLLLSRSINEPVSFGNNDNTDVESEASDEVPE